MESRAKLLGHPVHPMLIVFPLGLFITSLIFDIIHRFTAGPAWAQASFYMIGAGIIGGVIAAVFGLIDWAAIPRRTRASKIGLLHGGINVVVILLFAISWWLRKDTQEAPGTAPVVLSFIAVLFGAVSGWLGGELVNRLGVGVDPGAHLDAPRSLKQRTIDDRAA